MISPAIKPRVAFRPISRGLIVAARNSVNKVQESTQKISKGLDKNEKFAMNYVQFFGSKKTTKILKKNLKSIKESLMSTFEMAKTLRKKVGEMSKGGALGGILGFFGKGLLGGLLGKLVLGTLVGLATGGIAFLLYRNAAGFFRFLREKKDQLAPIIEGLIKRFVEKIFLPAGVQDLTDDLSTKVSTDIDALLQENPEMDRDEAVRKVIGDNVGELQGQIETLKEQRKELTGKRGSKDYVKLREINNQIQVLEAGIKFLKTGNKFLNPAVSFLVGERLSGTFYPEGYEGMTKKERLNTVVSYVETSPLNLDALDYQVSQAAALGKGSDSKVRFYEDVKNYIDAKRKGEQKDFVENKQVLPEIFDVGATRKENIKEFNERFNNIANPKSSNKNKNNINFIQSGSGNKRGSGANKNRNNDKLISAKADGGGSNIAFLSPQNFDSSMEKLSSCVAYGCYMDA